jgi:uncharacterized protein YdaU (DUF1376 family)
MNGLPYYKAYPRDFIQGTIGMPFEVKCAYRVVLDLIYMQGGNLPDDARYISGVLGCSVRKWKAIREALIDAGKIQVVEGCLINERADREIEALTKLQEKQRENARKSGDNSRETSRKVEDKPREKSPKSSKNNGLQKPRQRHPEPEPDTKNTTYSLYKENYDDSGSGTGPKGRGGKALDGDAMDAGKREGLDQPKGGRGQGADAGAGGADPGSDTGKPPATSRAARSTTIPDDFWPDAIGQQRFGEKGGTDLGEAVEEFIDHWRGKGERRADWQATWRTWCSRGVQYKSAGFRCGGYAGAGRNARGQTTLDIHLAGGRLAASGWADDTGF